MTSYRKYWQSLGHWRKLSAGLIAIILSGSAVAAQDNSGIPTYYPALGYRIPETITINIHEELGEDRDAIVTALSLNPNVRIGEPADFEIARFPDFPQDLILIDRAYQPKDVDLVKVYGTILNHTELRSKLPVRPKNVGRLDTGSFTPEVLKQLRRIARVREWISLQNDPEQKQVTTNVRFTDERRDSDTSYGGHLYVNPGEVEISVRNNSDRSKYIYVVQIDPDHHIITLNPDNGRNGMPVSPGSSAKYSGDDLKQYYLAQYRHITIASDYPINTEFFEPDALATISPGPDWSISVTAIEPPDSPAVAGGGGFITPYAPWQVQLYSTALTMPGSTPGAIKANDGVKVVTWENYLDVHRCGGALIAPDIVLTAAHCVANKPFVNGKEQAVLKDRRIRLGTYDLKSGGTTYAIDSIVVHKGYKPGVVFNDVAIIRIKPDRSTRANQIAIDPLALLLPDQSYDLGPLRDGEPVSWYGWGVTGETALQDTRMMEVDGKLVKQAHPQILREGEMAFLANDKCKARPGYEKVSPFMLCAATPEGPRDQSLGEHTFTCLGDSGGPIVRKSDDKSKYVQVGVISWAVGCGANDNPSVSANMYRYARWVRAAIPQFAAGKQVSFQE